jgi:dolichol-phosphate mannosyltransferase
MSGQGFKILLDLFASSPEPLRFQEFPFTFRARQHGESKLDSLVAWEYLMLIGDKLIGHVVPIRFISFVGIGAVGVIVNLATLWFMLLFGFSFTLAETLGTFVAMISNFMLNNQLTYRDRRLKGWGLLRGLLAFCIGCSIGSLAGVGIAAQILGRGTSWWLAGLAGAGVGVVWNYVIASNYTWAGRARFEAYGGTVAQDCSDGLLNRTDPAAVQSNRRAATT